MFIQTQSTPNPNSLKFLPGKNVSSIGPIEITDTNKTNNELIRNILSINGIKGVLLSDDFISHTLQPFLKGIFLENNLETSSKVFQYVLKMMLSGSIVVPTNGMGAIPKQLYKPL